MFSDGDILKILTLYPDSFGSNTHLVISNGHALVVDPSVKADKIITAAEADGAIIDGILLTHGHFDHIFAIDSLREALGIKLMMHRDDAEMITDSHKNAFFTFFRRESSYAPADVLFDDGYEISLGRETVKVIHTPGHTKGSVCYLVGDALITGDTLFADGIGRTDLYGGSSAALVRSLDKLAELDRNLKIYTGHGDAEILGHALDNSAYFRR